MAALRGLEQFRREISGLGRIAKAWRDPGGSGGEFLVFERSQSPKLKRWYRYKTRYWKPGFINGISQFFK